MHCISWDSESCDWNENKYVRRNAVSLWNPSCGFRTDLHFADVPNEPILRYGHNWPQCQWLFTIWYPQSKQKWRNSDQRAICNRTSRIAARCAVVCHRGVSVGSDGAITPGRKCVYLIQHVSWGLSKVHSNAPHCIVPKFSSQWSLCAIGLFIHLHKYSCNVSQVLHFSPLIALEYLLITGVLPLQWRNVWQSVKSTNAFVKFLLWCLIQNLWIPYWDRLWYRPRMNLSLFVIWATSI